MWGRVGWQGRDRDGRAETHLGGHREGTWRCWATNGATANSRIEEHESRAL